MVLHLRQVESFNSLRHRSHLKSVEVRLKVSTSNKDVKPAEVVLTLEMSTDPSNIGGKMGKNGENLWKELGHELFMK